MTSANAIEVEAPQSMRRFRFPRLQLNLRLRGGEAEALTEDAEPDGSFSVVAVTLDAQGPELFLRKGSIRPTPDPWWAETWAFVCARREVHPDRALTGDEAMHLFTSKEFWYECQLFGRIAWTVERLREGQVTWAELENDAPDFLATPQMVELRSALEPAGLGLKRARGRPRRQKRPENVLELVSFVELYRLNDRTATLEEACAFVVENYSSLLPKTWRRDGAEANLKREHARSGINLLRR